MADVLAKNVYSSKLFIIQRQMTICFHYKYIYKAAHWLPYMKHIYHIVIHLQLSIKSLSVCNHNEAVHFYLKLYNLALTFGLHMPLVITM